VRPAHLFRDRPLARIFLTTLALGAALSALGAGCSSRSGESTGGAALSLGEDAGDDAPVCRLGAECPPGGPCPDLTIDRDRVQSSAYVDTRDFAASDCAIFEGCVAQPGHRTLLRFDTATPNIGTADLVLGAPSTDNACFVYSSCHNHYHFTNYARYVLYAQDGTTVVATGHKQAFCLEDMGPAPGTNTPPPASPFNCSNQGLHMGYEDIYSGFLDCQWIDVTDVAPGVYTLSVTVNFAHAVAELDYSNNEVRVQVVIPSLTADAGPVVDGGDGGDGAASDPCMAQGDCAGCTAQAVCGWCNDGQIGCHTGTGQGPNGGVCAQTNWSWVSTQCMAPPPPPDAGTEAGSDDAGSDASDAAPPPDAAPVDPCTQLASCGACTAAAVCGWCSDVQGCFTGTYNGPNGAQCAHASWDWISNQCVAPPVDAGTTDATTTTDAAPPSDACNAFADCTTCTSQPVCGWCGSSCWTGTGSGPNGGACTQSQWTWISSSCH
jgi:hypothetical protein